MVLYKTGLSARIAVLVLALSAIPAAGGVKEGLAAYKAGDFETAFQEFLPVARAGNAAVQSIVAGMYFGGQGVEKDLTRAVNWFRAAALQGDKNAQYKLGLLYRSGLGVPKDENRAHDLLGRAAAQGHEAAQAALEEQRAVAQERLKQLYDEGLAALRSQDFPLALERLTIVAKAGHSVAQFLVGSMYLNGQGVPQSNSDALPWLEMAADQDLKEAQAALGSVLQSEGRHEEALQWYKRAAEAGHVAAQVSVGLAYSDGRGVGVDRREAIRWFEAAASQGDETGAKLLDIEKKLLASDDKIEGLRDQIDLVDELQSDTDKVRRLEKENEEIRQKIEALDR